MTTKKKNSHGKKMGITRPRPDGGVTSWLTYPFNHIFGKLPKFFNFSGGMAKSYSVELKLSRKSRFLNYKKFH